MRPTLLLALAFEAASPEQRDDLHDILTGTASPAAVRLRRLRRIYDACGVFEKAETLVDKSRARAESLADEVQPEALRQLLYFLVDTVLAEEEGHHPPLPSQFAIELPVVSM